MEYTISSRGRPIGTTELDFIRIDGLERSGWFHPTALGVELLPSIASPLPAMRAFMCRNVRDTDGRPIVQNDFLSSSLFADLAEALQHADAMELALHRPDGTIVPTSEIGIQDTQRLAEHPWWRDLYPVGEIPAADDEWFRESMSELDESPSDWLESSDDDLPDGACDDAWVPDEEPSLPRYQVHLRLSEVNAIP